MAEAQDCIVLGIDPGIALVGYAVLLVKKAGKKKLIHYGAIRTSDLSASHPQCLQVISSALDALITKYAPNEAAVERLFLGSNVTSAIRVGEARGVILLTLANREVPISEYWPSQVKLRVTGTGKANKALVAEQVRLQLALEVTPKPDDVTDAVAVALCHIECRQTI